MTANGRHIHVYVDPLVRLRKIFCSRPGTDNDVLIRKRTASGGRALTNCKCESELQEYAHAQATRAHSSNHPPVLGLEVVRRVPVGVKDNNLCCSSEVEAYATGLGGDEKHQDAGIGVELVGKLEALGSRCAAVKSKMRLAACFDSHLQQIKQPRGVGEQQGLGSVFAPLTHQLLYNSHLATCTCVAEREEGGVFFHFKKPRVFTLESNVTDVAGLDRIREWHVCMCIYVCACRHIYVFMYVIYASTQVCMHAYM